MKMNYGLFLVGILVIAYLILSGILSLLIMLPIEFLFRAIGAGDGVVLLVGILIGIYVLGFVFTRYKIKSGKR